MIQDTPDAFKCNWDEMEVEVEARSEMMLTLSLHDARRMPRVLCALPSAAMTFAWATGGLNSKFALESILRRAILPRAEQSEILDDFTSRLRLLGDDERTDLMIMFNETTTGMLS